MHCLEIQLCAYLIRDSIILHKQVEIWSYSSYLHHCLFYFEDLFSFLILWHWIFIPFLFFFFNQYRALLHPVYSVLKAIWRSNINEMSAHKRWHNNEAVLFYPRTSCHTLPNLTLLAKPNFFPLNISFCGCQISRLKSYNPKRQFSLYHKSVTFHQNSIRTKKLSTWQKGQKLL